MALWLFKEEPTHYSYARLELDGETTWDGINNALALKYLRQVRKGDRVFFYHTGTEKSVIGEMEVLADPQEGDTGVSVRVKPVRRLAHSVPLSRIKEEPLLAEWELVRLPRLSVMPVTEHQWQRIVELAAEASS